MLTFEDFEEMHRKYAQETAAREHFLQERLLQARKPDEDLKTYLLHSKDAYSIHDVSAVLAAVPGEKNAAHWYWLLELKSGLFAYTEAWCDESEWDRICGGRTMINDNLYRLIDQIVSLDVLANMLRQLRGEQTIGTLRLASTLNYPESEPINYYQFVDFPISPIK